MQFSQGQGDSTVGWALALQVADLDSICGTMSPEHSGIKVILTYLWPFVYFVRNE